MTFDYTNLYLNDTPPGSRLPEWLLQAFSPYTEQARQASLIEVHRDEVHACTIVIAHCGGSSYNVAITDNYLDYINVNHTSLVRLVSTLPPPPPLPISTSPYPILGWRMWEGGNYMAGYYGTFWPTPFLEAECHNKTSPSPHEDIRDRCGIYLLKNPNALDLGWSPDVYTGLCVAERVIEHESGYRAGLVRCIALDKCTDAPGWDGIPIMSDKELGEYEQFLLSNPEQIPYPNDVPAP